MLIKALPTLIAFVLLLFCHGLIGRHQGYITVIMIWCVFTPLERRGRIESAALMAAAASQNSAHL